MNVLYGTPVYSVFISIHCMSMCHVVQREVAVSPYIEYQDVESAV